MDILGDFVKADDPAEVREFFVLVRTMREAQKNAIESQQGYDYAKALEKQVDEWLSVDK